MAEVKAIAKLSVNFYIDAKNFRQAEELIDHWLRSAEDDDLLLSYQVTREDWIPEIFVPEVGADLSSCKKLAY